MRACTGANSAIAAVLSAVGILLVDLACCLAVLELRRRDVRAEGAPFRIAGGPIVPILACAVVVWLLTSARVVEFLAVSGVLVGASVLYLLRPRRAWRQERQMRRSHTVVDGDEEDQVRSVEHALVTFVAKYLD